MHNLGPWLKKIRKIRQLTLNETSKEIISPSFLSKFERGESDITLNNFLEITERLNITLDEVIFMQNNYKLGKIELVFKEIKNLYLNRNIEALKNLIILLEQQNEQIQKFTIIMIKILIHDLDSSYQVDDKEIQLLTDYLFQIEEWGVYELYLFGNSLSGLKKDTVILFSKELIKKTATFIEIKKFKEQFIKIMQNIVIFCLENNELNYSIENLKLIESLTNNTNMYFEKTKSKFLYGIYLIHKGEIYEGIELSKCSIKLMNEMGDIHLAAAHEQYLKKVISKCHI